jgi:CheY-like chemotaxis protein
VRPVTVLLFEDNDVALSVVKRTLELEGWRVECGRDGDAAMRELEGEGQYDLIITENELPRASGLELIQRTRTLPHRRDTPIIMFSSGPYRADALRAGANEFLKKPEGIYEVREAVALLLGGPGRPD